MANELKDICPGSYNKQLPHSCMLTYSLRWFRTGVWWKLWSTKYYRRCMDCDLREEVDRAL